MCGRGRQVLENARNLCHDAFLASKSEAASYKILAFEAARDGLRRFTVLSAVLMEPHTGQVLITQRAKVLTLASFTLDPSKMTGLEFCVAGLGFAEHQNEAWNALNVVCSMFAEVRDQPEGVRLIETILSYMAEALVIARNQVLEAWKDDPPMTWIPSRKDLKDIHNRNEEAARNRVRRQFTVRDTIFTTVKDAHSSGQQSSVLGKSFVLECMADRQIYDLGRKLVDLYQEQKILPLQLRETGNSSAFATYIYSSLGRPVVAEEYRNIFSSGKVNIRQSKSGTLIFVPHSCIVTMTTHGMVCKSIKVENSQVFEYNSADRFALLPHLISILGLREDDALLSALVTEMDENAYLVADPMTFDIRACMTRSLETSRRVFRVSALHEDARKFVGNDHYQGLVREAVSLLARLGATVPPEYVGRSCFYDITRDLKGYRDQSTQMQILFDRGVVLDGLGCQILVNESHILGKLNIAVDGGHVITHLVKNNLRKHRPTPEENNEEFKAMRAAVEAAGLVMMSAAFDIYGEVRLAVTRSDPGNGMFAIFDGCEAR